MDTLNTTPLEWERPLLIMLLALAALNIIGPIMLYSASYMYSKEVYQNSGHFFTKHLSFMAIGLVLTASISKIAFWKILKLAPWVHILAIGLIIMTFVPGVGISAKGATRWISIFGLSFQPAELLKYTELLVAVVYFNRFKNADVQEKAIYGVLLLLPLMLLALQPDFGSLFILFCLLSLICFISPFPRKAFYSMAGGGLLCLIVILFLRPYRVQRIMTFLDPWKDPQSSGFQIIQSYLAFAHGSIFGKGLGHSHEKLFYLPEAHNDFIFSVIGEELGLFGVACIIALFYIFFFNGLRVGAKAKNLTAHHVILSIIGLITLQVALNMGVVLGLLPTKGLNLPFISYGGSSLVCNFIGIGLILSAIKFEEDPPKTY